MALTKVTGAGVEGVTISSTTDTSDQFILTNTDTGTSSGPDLVLFRQSTSSAADSDGLGRIDYRGLNDANEEINYATIYAKISDASDGTENGEFYIQQIVDGSYVTTLKIDGSGDITTSNDGSLTIQGTHNEGGGLLDLKGTDTPADAKVLGAVSFGNSNDRSLAMIRGVSEATDAAGLRFYTEATGASIEEAMRITSSGQLVLTYSKDDTTSDSANANIRASDGLVRRSTSSLRYKNSIKDATHGLAELMKLRSVTYKGNNDGDIIFGGLIAEEVHDAGLTEFVDYDTQDRPDSLKYTHMVALCVKAIQELSAKNDALEARIKKLEDG